jgi:hypothetical protein
MSFLVLYDLTVTDMKDLVDQCSQVTNAEKLGFREEGFRELLMHYSLEK